MAPTASPRRGDESGFSLIEVMIAAFILFVVVGIAVNLVKSGNDMLATQAVRADMDVKAGAYSRQISRRIRNGLIDYVYDGSGGNGTSTMGTVLASGASCSTAFEMRLFGTYTGVVNPGATLRFFLVDSAGETSGDNDDDDGDGLKDERDLWMEQWSDIKLGTGTGGYEVYKLGSQVRDLKVFRNENKLTVSITVLRYDRVLQEEKAVTSTSTITLRN